MKYLTIEQLADHPRNVRAKSVYAEGGVDALAASIKALGLLQGLVVQQVEDGAYGVLAGRRRMMAMRQLSEVGDLEPGFKIPCKLIAKDVDHVTALSLAENTMQEPMAPLDEFEAFAAMIDEGATVDSIAQTFGATVRTVKERLRFGLVHADIRAAARAGSISLDVMKAYAGHPCQDTQKRVFDGFAAQPHEHQSWRVRNVLNEQDLRADDPLAQFVMAQYRERGGAVVEGLFEEDTVLTDRALAEACRDELLMAEAETLRARHGFKWAETRARLDYAELGAYSRIYPQAKVLGEVDEARLGAIAERLDAISEVLEADGEAEDAQTLDALRDEYDALEEEADNLQNGYLPGHAAQAGLVVALAPGGNLRVEMGLVRAEDYNAWDAGDGAGGADADASGDDDSDAANASVGALPTPPRIGATVETGFRGGSGKADTVDPLSGDVLSNALKEDLAVERAHVIAEALTGAPDLAQDVATFRLALSLLGGAPAYGSQGLSLSVQEAGRAHSRPEALDQDGLARVASARDAFDLSFLDASLTDGEKFRAFRVLDAAKKADILAACVALTIEPRLREDREGREPFIDAVAAEALPDIRTVWKPTAANYWSRVSRAHMLALLESFGLSAEADEHRTVKKATLAAYMESLFAQPFATLTEAQHSAVESWTPPGMATIGADPGVDTDAIEDAAVAVQDQVAA